MLKWLCRKLFLLSSATIIIMAVVFVILRTLTPYLSDHREQLSGWLAIKLKQEVAINSVKVTWHGFSPLLKLGNVTLFDQQHKQILKADQLALQINLWNSLLTWHFDISEVFLKGLSLQLKENAEGKVEKEEFKWIFERSKINLQQVNIDFQHKKQMLHIRDLAVVMRSDHKHHYIKGVFHLAQKAKTHVDFSLSLFGNPVTQKEYRGRGYFNVKSLQLSQWFTDKPFIHKGQVNAKLWADWRHGAVQSLQSLFSVHNAELKLPSRTKPIQINQANGNLLVKRFSAKSWLLLADQLQLTTDNKPWHVQQLLIRQYQPNKHLLMFDHIAVDRVLALFDKPWLNQFSPSAILSNTAISTSFTPHGLNSLAIDTDVSHWRNAAWHQVPALQEISGHLQASSIIENGDTHVKVSNSWLRDPHMITALNGEFSLNDKTKDPQISLLARIHMQDLIYLKNYYPRHVMDVDLYKWLTESIGHSGPLNVDVNLRGPLKKFPFLHHEGIFEVYTHVKRTNLHFDEEWPAVDDINADIDMLDDAIYFRNGTATTLGINLENIQAQLPEIQKGEDAILSLQGLVKSDMQTGQRYIKNSLLRKTVGRELRNIKLKGPLNLRLKLSFPLTFADNKTKVEGDMDVANGRITLPEWNLKLSKVKGNIKFSEDSINSDKLSGQLFGHPFLFQLQTKEIKKKSFTKVSLSGRAKIHTILKTFKLPSMAFIKGAANFNGNLLLASVDSKAPDQLHINSSLQGIKIKLPSPFKKIKTRKWPFVFNAKLYPDKMPLSLSIKNKLSANFLLRLKDHSIRRGHIKIGRGKSKLPSKKGIVINGALPKFDFKDWRQWFKKPSPQQNSLIRSFDLSVANLILGTQNFSNIRVSGYPTDHAIHLNLNNKAMSGSLDISHKQQTRVVATFKRLFLKAVASKQEQAISFANLPSLDFSCAECRYGKVSLGQVNLKIDKHEDIAKITELSAERQSWHLQARGQWQERRAGSDTHLDGSLHSDGVGYSLRDFGMPPSVIARQGDINFHLNWPGSPFAFSFAHLSGNATVEMSDGQVETISRDARSKLQTGRMLTFLSLSSLRRRLALDFSDMTDKGFTFDKMHGHFTLKKGNAYTKKAYFDGPVAYVGISGRIGLRNKDFDVQLDIIPYLTSSLPVVATIAAGPVVGVVTFIADKIVSPAVGQLTSNVYRMQGSWENPKVILLHRRQTDHKPKRPGAH